MILKSQHQFQTHYSPAGNDDVLDIVVHQNIRHLHVIESDILDSDNLPIVFYIFDNITTKKLSDPLESLQSKQGGKTC
jgi:hypothetical protein